ncbi:radical SAM family heme chaperone HemW [Propylenella binzhouense]|uniref:Heme chaperone HemW n=1 Tax=Propylenella binzhouense TaxID=2555902 RepID=A0A964T3U2_9HYPH|nr:radical SAM family heme chaperone HemW [Propylenella binzhouense]MYZ47414.1 coproporphyrinogen III oxidase [Propylenella binzhouense]
MSATAPASVPEAATAFGVYLHWPFCAAKCPYCDFNSHVRQAPPDQARFAAAFAREIGNAAALTPGRTVTSVFLGGGTPSLMAPATVAALLDAVAAAWPVAPDAEITLEANPSSVEAERFRGYRAAGVNRVSLGVQSLHDDALRALGRLHDAAEARRAIALARATFPRLSFDLIYARPGQSLAEWEGELEAAIGLAADHLSLYQLTIEPGTAYHRLHAAGRLNVPDADHAADLYELTQEVTARRGLAAYEISNHAAPGAESRHNLTYWRYRDYVGIGPGAHGRFTLDGSKRASDAERLPERWLELVETTGTGTAVSEPLTADEAADEMLLMGLRLREGIDLGRHAGLAGRGLDAGRIAGLADLGLVETTAEGRLRATAAGALVLNRLVAELA